LGLTETEREGATRSPRDARGFRIGIALWVAALGIGTLVATLLRTRYGIDFTDESFYVAIPYRFALGSRPFIDELNLQQSASLLLLPFYWARVRLSGYEGLMLFARLLYCGAAAVLVGVATRSLSRLVAWPYALLASLPLLVLAPFSIQNLSYNTLGAGLLTAGMVVALPALAGVGRDRALALAGVLHGLAVIAYPTLLVPIAAYCVAVWLLADPRSRSRALMLYVAGGAVVLVAFAGYLAWVGAGALGEVLRYTETSAPRFGSDKIAALAKGLTTITLWMSPAVAGFAALLLMRTRRPTLVRWGLMLVPFLPILAVRVFSGHLHTLGYALIFASLAPFVYPFTPRARLDKALLVWGFAPALVAGLMTAYTSYNGFYNGVIGLFPSVLITSVLLLRALGECGTGRTGGAGPRSVCAALLPVLAGSIVVTIAVAGLWTGAFAEYPIRQLTSMIASGPFGGIYTTPEKARFVAGLSADLAKIATPQDSVVFFDNFPAGYLFLPTQPATLSVWLGGTAGASGVGHDLQLAAYAKSGRPPTLAVKIRFNPFPGGGSQVYAPTHVMSNYFEGPAYRVVLDRADYTFYRLR